MAHVSLGHLAPSSAPIKNSPRVGASVVPNTVPLTVSFGAQMGLTPAVPMAEMGHKSGKTCHMHNMGKAGMRCRCNNKLAKKGRC